MQPAIVVHPPGAGQLRFLFPRLGLFLPQFIGGGLRGLRNVLAGGVENLLGKNRVPLRVPDVEHLLGLRYILEPIFLRAQYSHDASGLLRGVLPFLAQPLGDAVGSVVPLGGAGANVLWKCVVQRQQVVPHPCHEFVGLGAGVLLFEDVGWQVRVVQLTHVLLQNFQRNIVEVDIAGTRSGLRNLCDNPQGGSHPELVVFLREWADL